MKVLSHPNHEGRISSGIDELDVVLGGGFAPGSTTMILGCPDEGKTVLASQLSGGMALRLPASQKGVFLFNNSSERDIQHRMQCAFCDIPYAKVRLTQKEEDKANDFLDLLEPKLDLETTEKTLPDCLCGFSVGQVPAFLVYDHVGGLPSDDLDVRMRLIQEVSETASLAKKLCIPVIFFIQAGTVKSQGVLRLDTRHASECKTLDRYADTVIGISSVEDVNNIGVASRNQCLFVSKNTYGKAKQMIWVEREFEFQRFGFQSLQGAKIVLAPPQVF